MVEETIAETTTEEQASRPGPYEKRRAEIVRQIPGWYSPAIHLSVPTLIGAGIIAASLVGLRRVQPMEWITPVLTLLGGFAVEWRAHKSMLHKRLPGLGLLYDRHELAHHVVYTHDSMQMRSKSELWLILMPAYAIVLVFFGVVPFALLVRALAGENAARMMVATSMLFFLSYEWLHMAYHLPANSLVGRNRVIRALREFHRRHHDPRLMRTWNFNVTLPLFDVIHGTSWSEERARAREAKREQRMTAGRRSA